MKKLILASIVSVFMVTAAMASDVKPGADIKTTQEIEKVLLDFPNINKVLKVELETSRIYEAKVIISDGSKVKVYVDGVTGEVVLPRKDD